MKRSPRKLGSSRNATVGLDCETLAGVRGGLVSNFNSIPPQPRRDGERAVTEGGPLESW